MKSNRPKGLLAALMLILTASLFIPAQELSAEWRKPAEYDVKAAYIYNFAKFIEWPSDRSASAMTLCILGEDPFGPALTTVESKTVRARKIRIKRPAPQNLATCDILFISSSEKDRLPEILEAMRGLPVLTVADTEGFAQEGVMINLYLENNTVRFEINSKATARSGLRISSKLLGIARIVGAP